MKFIILFSPLFQLLEPCQVKWWRRSAWTSPNTISMHWWSSEDLRYVITVNLLVLVACPSHFKPVLGGVLVLLSTSDPSTPRARPAASVIPPTGVCGRPGAGSGQREVWGAVHSNGGHPRHRLQQCPWLWLQHRCWHCSQYHHHGQY